MVRRRNTHKKQKFFKNKNSVDCFYCCKSLSYKEATIDHLLPICMGGGNEDANVVVSCLACNNGRGIVPVKEWKEKVNLAIKTNGYKLIYKYFKKSSRLIERKYLI